MPFAPAPSSISPLSTLPTPGSSSHLPLGAAEGAAGARGGEVRTRGGEAGGVDRGREAGNGGASELQVVQLAQGGDGRAFEALYRMHAGRVFALCLRMTGERHRAQELAHDAFVRAWERLGSFRGESAFGSWLHRLTVNVVLERQRGERRRLAHEVPGDDLEGDASDGWSDAAGEGDSADSWAWQRATRGDDATRLDLEAAIARLPTNARTVFVLHVVEGYRHDEIATLMTIAEGTVRAHLHRARRLLMEYLSR